MRKLLPLVAALVLSGCANLVTHTVPETALPEHWPADTVLAHAAQGPSEDWTSWWQNFGDAELNRLVASAHANNTDLRLQLARIEEARARLGLARSEQLPSIAVQAEAARLRPSGDSLGLIGVRAPERNNFSLAGLLSYEIDLWGRLANERVAAEALLEESLFAREALELAIVTDVVATYFNLRSAERQREILMETLAVREETLRIEQIRYDAGETDDLVLSQLRSEVAATRAQVPQVQAQLSRLESALGLLLGREPAELLGVPASAPGALDEIVRPERIPAVLPSELLRRRPDLRAAEAALESAAARVNIAETARLPRLDLGLLLGTTALQLGDLFTSDAGTWRAGIDVSAPLFDFGRNRARIEAASAQWQQAGIRYEATVRAAFAEVRDALSFYDTSGNRLEATQQQLAAATRTRELAELRYREGVIGMIERLDAQRTLLSTELAHAEAVAERLIATAALFKALGGGWASEL